MALPPLWIRLILSNKSIAKVEASLNAGILPQECICVTGVYVYRGDAQIVVYSLFACTVLFTHMGNPINNCYAVREA